MVNAVTCRHETWHQQLRPTNCAHTHTTRCFVTINWKDPKILTHPGVDKPPVRTFGILRTIRQLVEVVQGGSHQNLMPEGVHKPSEISSYFNVMGSFQRYPGLFLSFYVV